MMFLESNMLQSSDELQILYPAISDIDLYKHFEHNRHEHSGICWDQVHSNLQLRCDQGIYIRLELLSYRRSRPDQHHYLHHPKFVSNQWAVLKFEKIYLL